MLQTKEDVTNIIMTRMQKVLDNVLPSYTESNRMYMCTTLKVAWLAGEITWEECNFATQEIETYLKHLGPYETLEMSLSLANLNSSKSSRELIYRNWSNRPMTSPTLEQKWITQALTYGLGIWEGLKTAEHAGDLTCTQAGIVKHSIEQFIVRRGREPTIQEMKDWEESCRTL